MKLKCLRDEPPFIEGQAYNGIVRSSLEGFEVIIPVTTLKQAPAVRPLTDMAEPPEHIEAETHDVSMNYQDIYLLATSWEVVE